MQQRQRYLELLSREYKNRYAVYTKLINLSAVLNMPKGTEHFISDIHGEYEAFLHILNNASGVIKEKVRSVFSDMPSREQNLLCTLIYYPDRVLDRQQQENGDLEEYYRDTVLKLVTLANYLSSKYSRSKVRKLIDGDFAFIIDELMHAKADDTNSRIIYHRSILNSIITTGSARYFIVELCQLIKKLAVDRLHVLGDIFDRGPHPDKCMDLLMQYHDLDLQWGNHDVLWMGACCGSALCAVNVLCNNIRYRNFKMLENGYGISLRKLAIFAKSTYADEEHFSAAEKAITVLAVKLIGQLVKRHPEYGLDDRLVLENICLEKGVVVLKDGLEHPLVTTDLKTIRKDDPYALTQEEQEVVDDLVASFTGSVRLNNHVKFLYSKGNMYQCCNGNVLYHGCIPLDESGQFLKISCNGRMLQGREYLDYCQTKIREAYTIRDQEHLDFLWYMWTGPLSPLSGRKMKLFERLLVNDKSTWDEPRNPYYDHYYSEKTCEMILKEFNLDPKTGHIINGHTPILAKDGETPVRAGGKLLVIDGGFCKAYQSKTGIAGYTLIFSSHYLHLKAHTPFTTIDDAIENNSDIEDMQVISVEEFEKRKMVSDTDRGAELEDLIVDLNDLLNLYKKGLLSETFTTENVNPFVQ
ncbi:MAG: fructose-1,6-bisphosphatase [Succinivibrio sp.]